jgi:hypothetical protein
MIPGAPLLETAGASPAVLLCAIIPLNYRVLNAKNHETLTLMQLSSAWEL